MLLRTVQDIGLLIRDTRNAAGITQAALAERVGASREWVRLVESGRKPRVELGLTLRALTALGIMLDARARPLEPDAKLPRPSGLGGTRRRVGKA